MSRKHNGNTINVFKKQTCCQMHQRRHQRHPQHQPTSI